MNASKFKVALKLLIHKEQDCYAITFLFNEKLKALVISIPHVRWSKSNKTFYVPKQKLSLHRLYTLLQEKNIYVDYSRVISSTPMAILKKKKQNSRNISEVNKQVIREFVSYLRGLRLSESTVMTYFTFVADFVEFIGEKPLDTLTNIDVRLFVENQVKHKRYAISTHRQLVSAIKHFGTFLPESQLSVEEIKRPKKSSYLPTVLSKEEIIDLLRATKNLKHRTILAMLYSAGLRISEILHLKLKDIDIDRRQLFIKNAKGRKDRVVVLAESFIPLLHNYYMTYTPAIYFIENPKGGKYSAVSIRTFIKKSCKNAHITKRVTPHTLRHSYATHLIEDGVGLRHVQDLLGHSKPETTMIYTHVAKKDLLQIRSPLDAAILALDKTDKKQLKQSLSRNIGG